MNETRQIKVGDTVALESADSLGEHFKWEANTNYTVTGIDVDCVSSLDNKPCMLAFSRFVIRARASTKSSTTIPELLDEIERRANAASPGPWMSAVSEKRNRAINIYAGSPFLQSSPVVAWAIPQVGDDDTRQANALLIAAARTDVPMLAKALRRANEIISECDPDTVFWWTQEVAQLLREPADSVPARTESAPASE